MELAIDKAVKATFPDLKVLVKVIQGVRISKSSPELENFKNEVYGQENRPYTLESLKDVSLFRAYRDFFWKVGTDPTKNRPAAEALIRRILGGKPIPQINTLVDSYNLASISSGIPLAAFDVNKLIGNLTMRFANPGEEFLGIGMGASMILRGGEIIISDASRIVAVYPYRDADYSKVTDSTTGVALLVCGVPSVDEKSLEEAGTKAVTYILKFCGGLIQ